MLAKAVGATSSQIKDDKQNVVTVIAMPLERI